MDIKTCIFQYWDGKERIGNNAGSAAMKTYADRIGADYIYELNSRWQQNNLKHDPYFGSVKPIFDEKFEKYDYVMFADLDVWPVEGLEENIFDQFYADPSIDFGICQEINMHILRSTDEVKNNPIGQVNDEIWAEWVKKTMSLEVPRDDQGKVLVYNSGVMVYNVKSFPKMRERMLDIAWFQREMARVVHKKYYPADQTYMHAHMLMFNWITMDYKWNSALHPGRDYGQREPYDLRENANFVHVQCFPTDDLESWLVHKVVNLPVDQWADYPELVEFY
jgi:hypothetical protein